MNRYKWNEIKIIALLANELHNRRSLVVQLEQLPSKKNMTGGGEVESNALQMCKRGTTIDQVRSIGMQTRVYDNRRGR